MKETLKCHGCAQQFPRGDMTNHTSPRSKTGYNYCPNCLKEVLAREMFSEKVCHIFGLKAPGPRIWTERKRIIEKYGYSDEIIINCLDYIYNTQKSKKLVESICLVNPTNVEKMLQYEKHQDYKENKFVDALITNFNNAEEIPHIKVRENTRSKKKTMWDNEDYLFVE